MVLLATCQNSPTEVTPSCGNTPTAAAMTTMIIHGAATLDNLLTCSKPNMATTVVMAPTTKTVITHPQLLGKISVREGMAKSNGIPTAVAETAIMAPARKQNKPALTKLYTRVNLLPAIFSSW